MPFREDPQIESLELLLIDLHFVTVAHGEAREFAAAGSPHRWIERELNDTLPRLARMKERLIGLRWPEDTYSAGQVEKKRRKSS